MSIKIESSLIGSTGGAGQAEQVRLGGTAANGKTRQTGAAGPDSVDLSQSTSSLTLGMAAVQQDRAAMVDALRSAFQSGRYQVNSQDLGRSIIAGAMQSSAAGSV